MSSSYQFELYLLGTPRLEQSSQPVLLSRRKEIGLLAYLAFGRREVSRDTLATLLWPNNDDSHARGSLRRLLSEIRKLLGPDLLPAKDDLVGPLDVSRIWTDVDELHSLMARIRLNQRLGIQQARGEMPEGVPSAQTNKELLRQAVDLYRGDFLTGFTLGDCRQFSDWQFQQGEYLRSELCTALERLVQLCEQDTEHAEGITYSRKLVEVDPLNEEAHCALMRLYAASGQRKAALRQYSLCEKYLQEELGLEPEDTTTELYQAIQQSRPVRVRAEAAHLQGTPRIAVLPFKSLVERQDWFSDGMTDALITELSRREELEVISYVSSARYRDTEKSLRQVAAELDVDYVLEGAVFKAGQEVRISAQLIEAVSDRHVWVESYRDSFANLMELQDKIAHSVVAQTIDKLAAGSERTGIQEISPEAREDCMIGDYLLRRSQSEEDIKKAEDYYLAAIEKNPRCADAFAGLAFTYFSLGGYGRSLLPTKDGRDKVETYVRQALQIDQNNVNGHMVLGGLRLEWDWDWAGAEREFQAVLQIDPRHIDTLNWYSFLKMAFCEFDEQSKLIQKAYRLDPLNLVTLVHLHRYYSATFQYRRSLQILDRIDELYPGRSIISAYRAWVYVVMGQYDAAISRGEALSDPAIYDMFLGNLVYAYTKVGQTDKALRMIVEMKDRYQRKNGNIDAYSIALACHGVGQDKEALQWLEKAYLDRDGWLPQLAHRTPWGELHWYPHFQDILRRIGVPVQLEYIRMALDKMA